MKISKEKAKEIGNNLNIDFDKFNFKQFWVGCNVELEHSDVYKSDDNELTAGKIALDHLKEIPDYYTRLTKMEKDAGINESSESDVVKKLSSLIWKGAKHNQPDYSAKELIDGWLEDKVRYNVIMNYLSAFFSGNNEVKKLAKQYMDLRRMGKIKVNEETTSSATPGYSSKYAFSSTGKPKKRKSLGFEYPAYPDLHPSAKADNDTNPSENFLHEQKTLLTTAAGSIAKTLKDSIESVKRIGSNIEITLKKECCKNRYDLQNWGMALYSNASRLGVPNLRVKYDKGTKFVIMSESAKINETSSPYKIDIQKKNLIYQIYEAGFFQMGFDNIKEALKYWNDKIMPQRKYWHNKSKGYYVYLTKGDKQLLNTSSSDDELNKQIRKLLSMRESINESIDASSLKLGLKRIYEDMIRSGDKKTNDGKKYMMKIYAFLDKQNHLHDTNIGEVILFMWRGMKQGKHVHFKDVEHTLKSTIDDPKKWLEEGYRVNLSEVIDVDQLNITGCNRKGNKWYNKSGKIVAYYDKSKDELLTDPDELDKIESLNESAFHPLIDTVPSKVNSRITNLINSLKRKKVDKDAIYGILKSKFGEHQADLYKKMIDESLNESSHKLNWTIFFKVSNGKILPPMHIKKIEKTLKKYNGYWKNDKIGNKILVPLEGCGKSKITDLNRALVNQIPEIISSEVYFVNGNSQTHVLTSYKRTLNHSNLNESANYPLLRKILKREYINPGLPQYKKKIVKEEDGYFPYEGNQVGGKYYIYEDNEENNGIYIGCFCPSGKNKGIQVLAVENDLNKAKRKIRYHYLKNEKIRNTPPCAVEE